MAEILETVRIPVLKIFVLRTGGTAYAPTPVIPVNSEPSPTNLA